MAKIIIDIIAVDENELKNDAAVRLARTPDYIVDQLSEMDPDDLEDVVNELANRLGDRQLEEELSHSSYPNSIGKT